MADPVVVLHLTQGSSIAGAVSTMNKAGTQCHRVIDPAVIDSRGKAAYRQLIPFDRPAKSLKHPKGTPETNNRGYTTATRHLGRVLQVEVVGFSERIEDYDDDWYERLDEALSELADEQGVPKTFPCEFVDDGYGVSASQRLSRKAFETISGFIGHEHVPDNEHWDPGPLDTNRLPRTGGDMGRLPDNRIPTIVDIQLVLFNAGFLLDEPDGDPGQFDSSKTRAAVHAMKNSRAELLVEVEDLRRQLREATTVSSAAKVKAIVVEMSGKLDELLRTVGVQQ